MLLCMHSFKMYFLKKQEEISIHTPIPVGGGNTSEVACLTEKEEKDSGDDKNDDDGLFNGLTYPG